MLANEYTERDDVQERVVCVQNEKSQNGTRSHLNSIIPKNCIEQVLEVQ